MVNEKCGACDHYHDGGEFKVCTNLHCNCDEKTFTSYVENNHEEVKTFDYYQSVIQKLADTEEKIRYMLQFIPKMRNTTDWEFVNQYWHLYLGFCTGMMYGTVIFNKISKEALPDSITRMRRKVCEPEHQAIVILQEEIKGDEKNGIPPLTKNDARFWEIQSEIKKIIQDSKFIPTDYELLKSKGIKEFAVKEALLEFC